MTNFCNIFFLALFLCVTHLHGGVMMLSHWSNRKEKFFVQDNVRALQMILNLHFEQMDSLMSWERYHLYIKCMVGPFEPKITSTNAKPIRQPALYCNRKEFDSIE